MGSASAQRGVCDPKLQGQPSPCTLSWEACLLPWSLVPGAQPLTFMSETGGKHRLVGRCLMVATLDSTAMFSAVRDGLGAGTISSGLSAV